MKKPAPASAAQKPAVRQHCDFAYVIQGDDLARSVKIGRTGSPTQRVSSLIAGVPFKARLVAVMNDGVRREREMKALLAPWRMRGEWYAPVTELNDFIRAVREDNGLFAQHAITPAFFADHIRPLLLQHLNEREPTFTDNGDFVYRLLREGLPAGKGRLQRLVGACPNIITPELIAGYTPLPFDAVTPQIEAVRAELAAAPTAEVV